MKKIFGLFLLINCYLVTGQQTIQFKSGQFNTKELPYAIPLTIEGDLVLDNGAISNLVVLQVRSLGSVNNEQQLKKLAQLNNEKKKLRKELELEGSATARLIELDKTEGSDEEKEKVRELLKLEDKAHKIEAKLYSAFPEETFFKSKSKEIKEFELSLNPLLYDTKYEFKFHFFINEEKSIETGFYDTLNNRLYKKFLESGIFNSEDASGKLEDLAQEVYLQILKEQVDDLGLKYIKINELVDEPKLIIQEGVDYGEIFIELASSKAFFDRRVESLSGIISELKKGGKEQKEGTKDDLDSLNSADQTLSNQLSIAEKKYDSISKVIDSLQMVADTTQVQEALDNLNRTLLKLKNDTIPLSSEKGSLSQQKKIISEEKIRNEEIIEILDGKIKRLDELVDQIDVLTIDNYEEKGTDLYDEVRNSELPDDIKDEFEELDDIYNDYRKSESESKSKLEKLRIEGSILQESFSITSKTMSSKTNLDAMPFRTDYGIAMTLNNEDPRIFRYIGVKIYLLENNDKSLTNKAAYNYEQFWTLRRLFVSVGFLTPGGLTFKGQSLDDIDDMGIKPTLAIGYDIRKEFAVNFGAVFTQQRFNLDGTDENRVRMFPFVSLSFDFDLFNKIKNSNP